VGHAGSVVARTADEEVVRELYAVHGRPLLGYVLSLVDGDRQRAEDVVQETLLRAWRHPEALDDQRGSTRSWLFTIARNLVIDAVRARTARPAEVSDAVLHGIPAAGSVETEIERAALGWAVADALGELPEHHRAVLTQTYFLGRSVAEASAALRVPAGTVKSRTYYALRQLRLLLEERGISGEGMREEVQG
jgi:RNA polymerase sigma-70 factor, ECF subfamily